MDHQVAPTWIEVVAGWPQAFQNGRSIYSSCEENSRPQHALTVMI